VKLVIAWLRNAETTFFESVLNFGVVKKNLAAT
jgi:hypothetical protein